MRAMIDTLQETQFGVGQIVYHRLFGYRGVIFDVDPWFQGEAAWYDRVARSRPPKDRPWYHVLVDGHAVTTYVAESNIEVVRDPEPIEHPFLTLFFNRFEDGRYRLTQRVN